eukprot:CAMPEP_0173057172 /NCGR_PEP_ID=MMETSP1102-20130122/569_1 /TAXON_ID=49646 /ORGANISM="Geminigera sp., Strain Caron Lab Isolate" /LENGTH=222 /DNA_ID=CAMNT_0013922611 /DNA_START=364 /DNA_END=1031 /DNA_ORIENTATION=-
MVAPNFRGAIAAVALEDADCGKSANFLPRKLVRAVAGSSPGHGAPEDAEQFLVLLCIRATVTRFSLQPSEAAPSSAAVSVPTLSQWTDISASTAARLLRTSYDFKRDIRAHAVSSGLNLNLLVAVFQLEGGQVINAGGKQQTAQDDNCARQPEGARWSYRNLAGLERVSLLFACFKVVLARLFLILPVGVQLTVRGARLGRPDLPFAHYSQGVRAQRNSALS